VKGIIAEVRKSCSFCLGTKPSSALGGKGEL